MSKDAATRHFCCHRAEQRSRIRDLDAAVAQLVEQFIRNEKVASSIPASGTIPLLEHHRRLDNRVAARVSGKSERSVCRLNHQLYWNKSRRLYTIRSTLSSKSRLLTFGSKNGFC